MTCRLSAKEGHEEQHAVYRARECRPAVDPAVAGRRSAAAARRSAARHLVGPGRALDPASQPASQPAGVVPSFPSCCPKTPTQPTMMASDRSPSPDFARPLGPPLATPPPDGYARPDFGFTPAAGERLSLPPAPSAGGANDHQVDHSAPPPLMRPPIGVSSNSVSRSRERRERREAQGRVARAGGSGRRR